MKLKISILTVLVCLLTVSCKKENEKAAGETEAPKVEDRHFTVSMKVEAAKDDNFAVYFTEDGSINFSGENAVWTGVVGGKVENLNIKLSEEVLPTHIRLDFGINKDQGNITVHHIEMKYYGKSFSIKGSEFFTYFIQNEEFKTELDQAAGTITFIKTEEQEFSPFFYPHQALLDQIMNITT